MGGVFVISPAVSQMAVAAFDIRVFTLFFDVLFSDIKMRDILSLHELLIPVALNAPRRGILDGTIDKGDEYEESQQKCHSEEVRRQSPANRTNRPSKI